MILWWVDERFARLLLNTAGSFENAAKVLFAIIDCPASAIVFETLEVSFKVLKLDPID